MSSQNLDELIFAWNEGKYRDVLLDISPENLRRILPHVDLSQKTQTEHGDIVVINSVVSWIETSKILILLNFDTDKVLEVSNQFNSWLYIIMTDKMFRTSAFKMTETLKKIIDHPNFSYHGYGTCNTEFSTHKLNFLWSFLNRDDEIANFDFVIIGILFDLLTVEDRDILVKDVLRFLIKQRKNRYMSKFIDLFYHKYFDTNI